MSASPDKLRVLLTNDDGPPGRDSPYIYGFARHLAKDLGWDVKVVIPSSQKSWIGKAYHINDIIHGRYYYPREPNGVGETSASSRPLQAERGEFAEWILLDGTPATCANVGLHNLHQGAIDLVISGPNLGRNSSSAFALSSGTIGAALSSSLSHIRSIALSYGTVQRPVPESLFQPAYELSGQIVKRLWSEWGRDPGGIRNGEVDLYNVNIPMIDELQSAGGMRVVWTTMWRNAYGRLFSPHQPAEETGTNPDMQPGGPDAQINSSSSSDTSVGRGEERIGHGDSSRGGAGSAPANVTMGGNDVHQARELVFKFAPDMRGLISPSLASLPVGSDAWAIAQGWASVTALRASFAEPPTPSPKMDPEGTGQSACGDGGEAVGAGDGADRVQGVKLFKL